MKAIHIDSLARLAGIAMTIVLLGGLTATISAQNGAKGGATKLLELSGGTTAPKSEEGAYKPMSCGKCIDELVTRVDLSARGANKPAIKGSKHLCGGCGTEWTVVGHGKAKASVANHKCTSCGAESLACCNTTKASTTATKGMTNKFQAAPLK